MRGIQFTVPKCKNKYGKFEKQNKIKISEIDLIRSENHSLVIVRLNKIGLSAYDDKRYILSDGIHSLSYGHYVY